MVRVIKVKGPIVLEFPDGTQIRIDPAKGRGSPRRQGRPLSPAALAMKTAMEIDHSNRRMGDRAHYLSILRGSGHKGSDASASLILNREAKRVFGRSLGRQKGLKRARKVGGKTRGRRLSHEAELLRKKITADKERGDVKEAKHYLSWLMEQPGVTLGLKPARPIVYRELRAAR